MSSETTAQKRARKAGERGVNTLQDAYQTFLQSPELQGLLSVAQQVSQNPVALGPDEVRLLTEQAASQGHEAARNQLQESRSQLSTGPGVRSGSARAQETEIASGLGNQIATGTRQALLEAALQRLPSLAQSANVLQAVLGTAYQQFPTAISNAQLGQASLLSNIAAQPTPLGQALGTLGGLGGIALGGGGLKGGGNSGGSSGGNNLLGALNLLNTVNAGFGN